MKLPKAARDWAVFVGIAVLLVCLRVLAGAWMEQRDASTVLQQTPQDTKTASLHWGRCIRWYLPGNPLVGHCAEKLEALAASQRAAGAFGPALETYRTLHGAIYSTRSFYQPQAPRLDATRIAISELVPLVERNPQLSPEKVLAELRASRDPKLGWSALACIGFLIWIGAVIGLIRFGFSADGRFSGGRRASACGFTALLAFGCWLVGLWLA